MAEEIYSVILAGKSGARLWPLDNDLHPSVAFSQQDEYSLLEQTFIKLIDCVDDKNILCVTDTVNSDTVRNQLKNLQEKFCRTTEYKIIEEPEGRGSASAVSLSVRYVSEILNEGLDNDPLIIILPSDVVFGSNKRFDYFIEKGKSLAQKGYIVSFAVKPCGINTDVGYITTRNDKKISSISKRAFKVSKFVEKPNKTEVKELIKNKKTFVNCGVYIFKASVFLNQLKTVAPGFYTSVMNFSLNKSGPVVDFLDYSKLPQISIEHLLLEKSKKMAVELLKLDFKDTGSWKSLEAESIKDNNGNTFLGNIRDIGSENTFVCSFYKPVTTIGLKDLFVIETQDNLLVSNKDEMSKINQFKLHKTSSLNSVVYKPWGYYRVLNENVREGFLTKLIYVHPFARLSLQTHEHRSEHWVVLSGTAKVIKGSEELVLHESEGVDIFHLEPHSLQNPFDIPLKVLEIQTGEMISEDDITRLEDIYGRV